MLFSPGLAVSGSWVFSLVSFNLEALAMYGLLAFVVGLIAWSKYNEPAISNPYPDAKPRPDLPTTAGPAAPEAVVAIPAAGQAATPGAQPVS